MRALQPVDVPEACRTVWDEAAKDDCFARAARAVIARDPLAWLARAPAKLAVTLDYFGAGPWYLHESNPRAFDDRAKVALGRRRDGRERRTPSPRCARAGRSRGGPRRRPSAPGSPRSGAVLAACLMHGWIAYLALAAAILAFGPRYLARAPLVLPWTAVVILVTAATHVVFFGAGRYGLVVVPFVTALAFVRPRAPAGSL